MWNEDGASLALVILPRYWQTWWFRGVAAAVVVALLVAAYEFRLASERKLVWLRLRIARDLHDEVGSNLGSIALLSEMIPKAPGAGAEEIGEIRRIALQTVGALRDIVWLLDPAEESMEGLVLRMQETARSLLPGIPFEFELEGHPGSSAPSLHLRRNVLPMFKEMLHNAAKHARASRVEIRVRMSPRHFQFRVSDNGAGFDEARIRGGNGLKNLRRRAADLEASLEIRTQPGQGTTVCVSAPIT